MKGMSRHSQMAKIKSPGRHHKWKNGRAGRRADPASGNGLCDSKPEGPPEASADPLGVLVNTDSGKLNRDSVFISVWMLLKLILHSIVCGAFNGKCVKK